MAEFMEITGCVLVAAALILSFYVKETRYDKDKVCV